MQQTLSAKRENFRQELRKKDKQTRLANKRTQLTEEQIAMPMCTFDEALKMFLQGRNDCFMSLAQTIDLQNQSQAYRRIMQLIDSCIMTKLVSLLKQRSDLKAVTTLLVCMTSLKQKKTGRALFNSGCISYLISLFGDWTLPLDIHTNILNILGNLAIEDINYRDALLKSGLHGTIFQRVWEQQNICSTIYKESDDFVFKRFWHFCFWYLQALGQYEQCIDEPNDIITFVMKFMTPEMPVNIIRHSVTVMNDFSKYIQPYLSDFSSILYNLLTHIAGSKKALEYTKEVIHAICYLDQLTFANLKQIYVLLNPKYYAASNSAEEILTLKSRFMLCRVILRNMKKTEIPPELKDEFFWQDLIISATSPDDRAILFKILTNLGLEAGKEEWAYRYASGSLESNTELHQLLSVLNFLTEELKVKSAQHFKRLIEKFSIDSRLQALQRKKSSAVYQKVEGILCLFNLKMSQNV